MKTHAQTDPSRQSFFKNYHTFVGTKQFSQDYFDNQLLSDEKSKLVFSSVEQTLKKNMAE